MPPEENPLKVNSSSLTEPEGADGKLRRIVLLAAPPAMELDIVGPASVFEAVNRIPNFRGPGCRVEFVTTGSERTISGYLGISLVAHRRYSEVQGEVDTLLVVGGAGARLRCEDGVLVWCGRWPRGCVAWDRSARELFYWPPRACSTDAAPRPIGPGLMNWPRNILR